MCVTSTFDLTSSTVRIDPKGMLAVWPGQNQQLADIYSMSHSEGRELSLRLQRANTKKCGQNEVDIF